ncbi:hypothetical protein J40TS1_21170 [Paenibacillus montaniterrae]|uniref:SMP-30/Gluconolactonase/LRE-like region domain-containing protein n=1 Tax=Paenibacillus montaniterrae TaxID=429341 RepID=A0A920CXM2_9BACL|nr:hypothetical protein [Paenibacillus montaniterrae]GIP16475.1 hypothetical protein J40TS1_21170 [Paenibacillus montaniterrae]
MKSLKKVRIIVLMTFMMSLLASTANAATPYESYTINSQGQDIRSIAGFVYEGSITGLDLESGALVRPESLFITADGMIYIADAGNNRIVQLNKQHQYVRTIGDAEGPGKLSEPKGVYVKEDGTIYVADTKNGRIVIFNKDGQFEKEFLKPESPLIGSTFSYSPSKIILDKRDYMYVVSDGNTQGLIQLDPTGQFKGFYGANHVGFSWSRLLIRLIATESQQQKIATVRPAEFSNLDIDKEGFMYTTTIGEAFNQIKRLSPVGVDTLNIGMQRQYGDFYSAGPFSMPSFIGVSVDQNGIITALDLQTSKVFQYDKLGNFLFAFGGVGEQRGMFTTPADLAQTADGDIYVVDRGRNTIEVFRKTPFAELVQKASTLYVDGRYDEAKEMWAEVIRLNSNYEMAYQAIGKALYKEEKYKEAMEYFKLASARGDYSMAFKEYRKELIKENFAVVAIGIIVLFILLRIYIPKLTRWLARKVKEKSKQQLNAGAQPAVQAVAKEGETV